MADPVVLIFHRPASADDAPLVRLLADARRRLADSQARLFERAGALVRIDEESSAASFGDLLRAVAAPLSGGIIVMGSGAVPRLGTADARQLVETAASGKKVALTNNRYSSDVCAIGGAAVLVDVPPLPSDNALPRWLEKRIGFEVRELPSKQRLALDLDSPADIGLWAMSLDSPAWPRALATDENLLADDRIAGLRRLAADPRGELLVFGRAGSSTLRWLERNVRCRVRFLAEERGLRASSPLAIGGSDAFARSRPPRASIGRLLESRGPASLSEIVADLADGAILDTRVLMADRFGADEAAWPPPADRFASDLLRWSEVNDSWLRDLTKSALAAELPILLGAHSLVGPGIPLLLRQGLGRR